ncbi:MAG: histidine phosphatase family protein [Candidatus Eremiobacteraeota bacterium]|nr:histidine phosphatase family protein [Candidatus Eremiobacteraeota bacterium]
MIVLCRHGATDENLAGAFLSTNDPPLNDVGRAQCERVRNAIGGIALDVAFTSPMRRCTESLAIIAPGVACESRDALREVDFGDWNGKTREWLLVHDPEGLAQRAADPANFRPKGGESFADVAIRLQPFAGSIEGDERNVLIVGHRGTLGVLERLLRGLSLDSSEVAPLETGEFRVLG